MQIEMPPLQRLPAVKKGAVQIFKYFEYVQILEVQTFSGFVRAVTQAGDLPPSILRITLS